uniref:Uncharacterized protein n=1 Tax=Coccidioides posadasii RMSCC 3488 TaxID=454284 RepID=A0A0J6F8P0_COCPO|nr:hypothetical protein CPAG_01675 [Coccidioides posadasii RMSCC 3488]
MECIISCIPEFSTEVQREDEDSSVKFRQNTTAFEHSVGFHIEQVIASLDMEAMITVGSYAFFHFEELRPSRTLPFTTNAIVISVGGAEHIHVMMLPMAQSQPTECPGVV